MGNQKSLYKTYFNEVYLKKSEKIGQSSSTKGGGQMSPSKGSQSFTPSSQTPSSTSQSRTMAVEGGGGGGQTSTNNPPPLLQLSFTKYATPLGGGGSGFSGRATTDSMGHSFRQQSTASQRPMKTFKVVIDDVHTIVINVPEKIMSQTVSSGDQTTGTASQQSATGGGFTQQTGFKLPSQSTNMEVPTCGWLLEQTEIKYAQLVKQLKKQKSNKVEETRFRKKLIVGIKTVDKNESIDLWLTQYHRPLKPLPNGLILEAHYSKIVQNKPKAVCANDFEALKVIGKGGFSRVYLVRKKDTGFLYGMKVMKKSQVTNDSKLKQIMNERTIMEQLADHPFIIKLHYAFQSKEDLHFITDLCTGGEMFYHLQQNGRFPEFLAKFYFVEILLGIEFLHSKNIVYRDLKPENVLIDIDGHVRIADFGLSKIFKEDERSYSFCGSPEYMCPEILKREGHNHMVDYYTLGAILFEMLTGLPPYYTNNKSEMTMRILESTLTFPDHLNPEAVTLIKSLLERSPIRRLGHENGVEDIKNHAWLKDIDWDKFINKQITPPWKPRLDKSNFDPEYTDLPLNFDEDNFKRSLQGDREFSFYYESPCVSMTVTENSIYASNPNLHSNTTNAELLLQSGSSKKLLDYFFMQQQQPHSSIRVSGVFGLENFQNLIPNGVGTGGYDELTTTLHQQQQQQHQYSQLANIELSEEVARRINLNLIRDESKISLEFNQDSGLTTFRGFSFFGESDMEKEVKRQLIKYSKLRNKLNKKLKKIQDEEGVIKKSHLLAMSTLSSPNSSFGSMTAHQMVAQTPPMVEDASSRNSNPQQFNFRSTSQADDSKSHNNSNSSNSPVLFQQIRQLHQQQQQQIQANAQGQIIVNKNMKQKMIFNKLEETKTANKQFHHQSFQIPGGSQVKHNSMAEAQLKSIKNNELFRSNVEPNLAYEQLLLQNDIQASISNYSEAKSFKIKIHQDFLDESIDEGNEHAINNNDDDDNISQNQIDEDDDNNLGEDETSIADEKDNTIENIGATAAGGLNVHDTILYNNYGIGGGPFSTALNLTLDEEQRVSDLLAQNSLSKPSIDYNPFLIEGNDDSQVNIDVVQEHELDELLDTSDYQQDSAAANTKFLIFQSQNVQKQPPVKKMSSPETNPQRKVVRQVKQHQQLIKSSNKVGGPQRSRVINKKDFSLRGEKDYLRQNNTNNSNTYNQNSNNQGTNDYKKAVQTSIGWQSTSKNSFSIIQAMLDNSSEMQMPPIEEGEQKSVTDKTAGGTNDYISTKHTYYDHQSIKSQYKRNFEDDQNQLFYSSFQDQKSKNNITQHSGIENGLTMGQSTDKYSGGLTLTHNQAILVDSQHEEFKLESPQPRIKEIKHNTIAATSISNPNSNQKSKKVQIAQFIKKNLQIDIKSPPQGSVRHSKKISLCSEDLDKTDYIKQHLAAIQASKFATGDQLNIDEKQEYVMSRQDNHQGIAYMTQQQQSPNKTGKQVTGAPSNTKQGGSVLKIPKKISMHSKMQSVDFKTLGMNINFSLDNGFSEDVSLLSPSNNGVQGESNQNIYLPQESFHQQKPLQGINKRNFGETAGTIIKHGFATHGSNTIHTTQVTPTNRYNPLKMVASPTGKTTRKKVLNTSPKRKQTNTAEDLNTLNPSRLKSDLPSSVKGQTSFQIQDGIQKQATIKPQVGIKGNLIPSSLKKGTPGTNSTMSFARHDTGMTSANMLQTKILKGGGIIKPPLSKLNEGQVGQINPSTTTHSQSKKIEFFDNSGPPVQSQSKNQVVTTPNGTKRFMPLKEQGGSAPKKMTTGLTQSQPSSTKNSKSTKIQFPFSTNITMNSMMAAAQQDQVVSPKKKQVNIPLGSGSKITGKAKANNNLQVTPTQIQTELDEDIDELS